ncbi:MAG: XRE family transcriptional regulator [Actinomycetes bacterium]
MSSIGEAIATARRARGLTQADLAEQIGVRQAALSRYESDLREPDEETLALIAEKLGVTARLLQRAGNVRGAMAVDAHMRRRATAKVTDWRQLEAQLNMLRIHTQQVWEIVGVQAPQSIPTFDPIDTIPADAARMVRMQWRMPIGPVHSLTPWLESAGCFVVKQPFPTRRVDGLSQWIDSVPVMMLNEDSPPDRLRLTMAHELGHLCLHSMTITEDVEQDANDFAAEFLMPADVIRPELRNLTTARLHNLKRKWGVSMGALIERAYHLNVIPAAKRTSLWKQMSFNGWRTVEPLSSEVPQEVPKLDQAIAVALSNLGLPADEVAHMAGYSNAEENRLFRPKEGKSRLSAV